MAIKPHFNISGALCMKECSVAYRQNLRCAFAQKYSDLLKLCAYMFLRTFPSYIPFYVKLSVLTHICDVNMQMDANLSYMCLSSLCMIRNDALMQEMENFMESWSGMLQNELVGQKNKFTPLPTFTPCAKRSDSMCEAVFFKAEHTYRINRKVKCSNIKTAACAKSVEIKHFYCK